MTEGEQEDNVDNIVCSIVDEIVERVAKGKFLYAIYIEMFLLFDGIWFLILLPFQCCLVNTEMVINYIAWFKLCVL